MTKRASADGTNYTQQRRQMNNAGRGGPPPNVQGMPNVMVPPGRGNLPIVPGSPFPMPAPLVCPPLPVAQAVLMAPPPLYGGRPGVPAANVGGQVMQRSASMPAIVRMPTIGDVQPDPATIPARKPDLPKPVRPRAKESLDKILEKIEVGLLARESTRNTWSANTANSSPFPREIVQMIMKQSLLGLEEPGRDRRKVLRQLADFAVVDKQWAVSSFYALEHLPDALRRQYALHEWRLLRQNIEGTPMRNLTDHEIAWLNSVTQLLLQRWRLNPRDGVLYEVLSLIRCNPSGPGPEHFANLPDLWREDAKTDAYQISTMGLLERAGWAEFFKLHGPELRHFYICSTQAEAASAMIEACPNLSGLSILLPGILQVPGPWQWLANAKSLRRLCLEDGRLHLRLIPDEMRSAIESLKLFRPTRESLALLPEFTALKELVLDGGESLPLSALGDTLPAGLTRLEGVQIAKKDVPKFPNTLRTLKLACDAPILSDVLDRLPQLVELSVTGTFTKRDFNRLAEYVRRQDCQLRVLKLRDLGKKKVGVQDVVTALEDNDSLEELHLNGVSIKAWTWVAKVLDKGRLRVLRLQLNRNKVTSAEFDPLMDAIETCTSLCSLTGKLSKNHVAVDKALEQRLRRFERENRSIAHVKLQVRDEFTIKFDNLAYMDKPAKILGVQ